MGGLLGGAFVGVFESAYINLQSYSSDDWSGYIYAVLLYGAIGLGLGVGPAVVAAALTVTRHRPPESARTWTVSFLTVVCGLSVLIGQFVLSRDFFSETPPPRSLIVQLGLALAVFSVGFYVVFRNALAKTFFSFLTRAAGSLRVYGLVLAFWLAIGAGTCIENKSRGELSVRPIPSALEDRPNVLLIVVDTLRADALGPYGGLGTPHFDAFAREATLYEQAITQAPWTRPAFASMLTSTVPCTHQTFRKADSLPDSLETLPEQLQLHGYTTAALVNNINVTASWGFSQGFDTFEFLRPAYPFRASEASFRLVLYQGLRMVFERFLSTGKQVDRYYRDAEAVTDAATRWLVRHGRSRWFLMLQYMDPHDPYFPHPYDGTGYARVEHPHPDPSEAPALKQLYAGEVTYWDEHFGRLMAWLRQQGLDENTVVVVTSDHGEEFAEHGGFWHGNRLYDEAILVPLAIRVPNESPGRVKDQVRIIDLAPTLADLAGAPHGLGWQGFSLRRSYALRQPRDRLSLSEADFEGFELRAVRDREWKLIENLSGPPGLPRPDSELFFLSGDPGEQKDLSNDSTASSFREVKTHELTALQAAGCGQAVVRDARDAELSAADCEMLRSLGYVDIAEGLCGG
jgi:arylsulfatase A-like enzyme